MTENTGSAAGWLEFNFWTLHFCDVTVGKYQVTYLSLSVLHRGIIMLNPRPVIVRSK